MSILVHRTIRCSHVALFAAWLVGCHAPTAFTEYSAIRMSPRNLSVSLGTAIPLNVTITGIAATSATDTLSRADVALSIADTSYVTFKGDSIAGRTFGSTYLRAELKRGSGRRLRDSVPVYVIRVG